MEADIEQMVYNPCENLTNLGEIISGAKLQFFFKCSGYGSCLDGTHSSFLRIFGFVLLISILCYLSYKLGNKMLFFNETKSKGEKK